MFFGLIGKAHHDSLADENAFLLVPTDRTVSSVFAHRRFLAMIIVQ